MEYGWRQEVMRFSTAEQPIEKSRVPFRLVHFIFLRKCKSRGVHEDFIHRGFRVRQGKSRSGLPSLNTVFQK